MALYNYGGPFDFLERIHFPKRGSRFPPWVSQPYYYFLELQLPTYFSYLGGVWGSGWAARANLPVIKILAADTQPIVPTTVVGHPSLEAAADTYVRRWDEGHPLAVESFGRINPKDKFFWKVLGMQFPKWAAKLDGLAQHNANSPFPAIGPYMKKAVTKYFTQWDADSNAYTAHSTTVPADGGNFLPVTQHSFKVPFPHPTLKEGGNFRQLNQQIAREEAWFGPIPASAWTNINLINTQSYAFTYGFGQLDPDEWDLSAWPPRRTSIPQREGGSPNPPSAISEKWSGVSPFANFIDHQFDLL